MQRNNHCLSRTCKYTTWQNAEFFNVDTGGIFKLPLCFRELNILYRSMTNYQLNQSSEQVYSGKSNNRQSSQNIHRFSGIKLHYRFKTVRHFSLTQNRSNLHLQTLLFQIRFNIIWGRVVNATRRPLYPREITPVPIVEGLVGPQGRSEHTR